MSDSNNRLVALDGLRGIAIFMVMGFHYFAIESHYSILPYGSKLGDVSIFKYGFMGVDLFFIISGFVIALTLQSCPSPRHFFMRRFARIWPTLTAASIITFFVLNISQSPFADLHRPGWADFIPSLTLTPNILWSSFFPNIDLIASVYWTLVVEAQFYCIAALIFWSLPKVDFARNVAIFAMINIAVRAALKKVLPEIGGEIYQIAVITDFLPWFAAGTLFFNQFDQRRVTALGVILLLVMFAYVARACTLVGGGLSPAMMILFTVAFFLIFVVVVAEHPAAKLFEFRPIVFLGVVSYSLYLFHEPLGLILLSDIPSHLNGLELSLTVIAVFSGIILFAFMSFTLIEVPCRKALSAVRTFRQRTN